MILAPRAVRDVAEILAYIETQSEVGAKNVFEAICGSLALIAERPELGAYDNATKTRSMIVTRYPYRIYFEIQQDAVRVLHIRHTRRKPLRSRPNDS